MIAYTVLRWYVPVTGPALLMDAPMTVSAMSKAEAEAEAVRRTRLSISDRGSIRAEARAW